MLENPTLETAQGYKFCAIRKRKPDGSPNVGRSWLEPFGSTEPFVEDQKTWEVVFYNDMADIKALDSM